MGNTSSSRPDLKQEINILLVGDEGVGKTTLIRRLTHYDFDLQSDSQTATHPAYQAGQSGPLEFTRICSRNNDPTTVRFWDTPGANRPNAVSQNLLQKADAILILYNITDRNIFFTFVDWFYYIMDNTDKEAVVFLVGTKCDVRPRAVSLREVEGMAFPFSVPVFETSAIKNLGVQDAFDAIMYTLEDKVLSMLLRRGVVHNQPSSTPGNLFSFYS